MPPFWRSGDSCAYPAHARQRIGRGFARSDGDRRGIRHDDRHGRRPFPDPGLLRFCAKARRRTEKSGQCLLTMNRAVLILLQNSKISHAKGQVKNAQPRAEFASLF
jgi:hypothetical protein